MKSKMKNMRKVLFRLMGFSRRIFTRENLNFWFVLFLLESIIHIVLYFIEGLNITNSIHILSGILSAILILIYKHKTKIYG